MPPFDATRAALLDGGAFHQITERDSMAGKPTTLDFQGMRVRSRPRIRRNRNSGIAISGG